MDLNKLSDENIKFSHKLSGFLSDFYSKFRTIKFFGNYEHEKTLFNEIIEDNYKLNSSYGWPFYFFVNSIFLVNFTIISLVVLFGSYFIVNNRINKNDLKWEGTIISFDIGQVVTIIISVFTINIISREYLILAKNVSNGMESARNYFELLEKNGKKSEIKSIESESSSSALNVLNSHSSSDAIKEIKVCNVFLNYFSITNEILDYCPQLPTNTKQNVDAKYENDEQENKPLIELNKANDYKILKITEMLSPDSDKEQKNYSIDLNKFALKNINLVFSLNKINYLIGKTGSGKTSILSLLVKLFKPCKGEIFLDDKNISEIDNDSYSSLIGYVPQESLFYNISIRENIRFFRDEITDEDINYICNYLKMDFVNNFEDGLDSKIGHNGSAICGGQKQLISMARALVKKSKIILLDEFTSNMDNILTFKVSSILKDLAKEMIVIIVTHKIKLLDIQDEMNNIVVLDSGEISNIKLLDKISNKFENFQLNSSSEEHSDIDSENNFDTKTLQRSNSYTNGNFKITYLNKF